MKGAKCKLCGEEHYGLCKSFQEEVQKPLKKIKEIAVARVSAFQGTVQPLAYKPISLDIPLGCPVCEARRKLKSLQMKRYRAKKKGL